MIKQGCMEVIKHEAAFQKIYIIIIKNASKYLKC